MANYTPVNVQAGDLILASHINPMSAQVAENETNISSKQNTLVSGQNIKTINGVSLLGSGNITISGSKAYTKIVDLGETGLTEATERFDVDTNLLSTQQYTDIIAVITTKENSVTGNLRCYAYSSGSESSIGYITLPNAIGTTTSVMYATFHVWNMGDMWNNEGTIGTALSNTQSYGATRFKAATDGAYIRSFYIIAPTTNVPIPAGATIKIYAR